MRATIVGLVTPHLLRIVEPANEAEKAVNVDWHLRDSVTRTMRELGDQYNAAALVTAYSDGLESPRKAGLSPPYGLQPNVGCVGWALAHLLGITGYSRAFLKKGARVN
ncbi:hypothetical protein [Cognatiluteimonas telluris]|uniref:hypothetical protein n=1 Tax=Cognatiluteimonas telluris TaxID=1104775 RepID=UPI00140DEEAE|nr:hypothetical protein [Lysobacter telluris]